MKVTAPSSFLDSIDNTHNQVKSTIRVGKDVLELLTGSMYVDPLAVFREYVQNAADSIDDARAAGLYVNEVKPRIDITIDTIGRNVVIRDNGVGIPSHAFWDRITAIGDSKKRGENARGFRGVGRFSGLGYAQEVIFRSRAPGETTVNEIIWDSRKLRELLRSSSYRGDLSDIVTSVSKVSSAATITPAPHFFEVELRRLIRIKNDLLLNEEEVRHYLSQVGPVPFSPEFPYGAQVTSHLQKHNVSPTIEIFLNGSASPLYRQFSKHFEIKENVKNHFSDIEFLDIPGVDGGVDATGWILHHPYFGAFTRKSGLGGLRVRAGNIQIGGSNLFEQLFPESRFNAWCVGEFHALTRSLTPNGRRDDFEINPQYQNLQSQLSITAARLTKLIRDKSVLRNRLRVFNSLLKQANTLFELIGDKTVPAFIRKHHVTSLDAIESGLQRAMLSTRFSPEERLLANNELSEFQKRKAKLKEIKSSDRELAFLPKSKRIPFLDFSKLILEVCQTPEEGSKLVKKLLDKIKTRYSA